MDPYKNTDIEQMLERENLAVVDFVVSGNGWVVLDY